MLRTWHAGESDASPAAHQAAGRWLRALHSLDRVPHDAMTLQQAIGKRIAALVPQLPDLWRSPLQGLDLSTLAGVDRVWCHRDLHPRNWAWDGARLVVFDFEHAAPDLGALDWVRVPDRASLLEGYGGLKDKEEELLFISGVVSAAATLAWGLRHDDAHWVFTGQQRLRAWIPIG
ncbi:MAG: Ser/Thr protein kinase RdoA (MazF antagonist) [Cognaticolwellia sp.]